MTRQLALIVLFSVVILACGTAIPVAVAPEATETPTATAEVSVQAAVIDTIEMCTFIATTDTNVRECGGIGCPVRRDVKILQGETVTGVCTQSEWVFIAFEQYACIPALTGTGYCQ